MKTRPRSAGCMANVMFRLSAGLLVASAGCVSEGRPHGKPDNRLEAVLQLESQIQVLESGERCGAEYNEQMGRLLSQRIHEYWSWNREEETRHPTKEEHAAIEALILQNAKEHILRISMCGTRRAVVTTGAQGGPLVWGGGSNYFLVKDVGGWRIAFRSGWVF